MSRFLSFLVVAAALICASPASAAIKINEVNSDGTDFVELVNTGSSAVNIGGYVIKDSTENNAFTVPGGTSVAAGGFISYNAGLPGLSSGDSVRLFAPGDPTAIDAHSWTSHPAHSYGRCPDGTGAFEQTRSATPAGGNDCFAAGSPWPGGSTVSGVSGFNFGDDVSGLAYQPSGTGAKGVLWAVENGTSRLFRLLWDGTQWTPDTANGWAAGKVLHFPDGTGVPDAEGITFAGGDATGIYASIERNDSGAAATQSRPGVLRFDVTGAGATLNATREWNLTGDLPGLPANAGLEAITWVPDSLLVAKGLKDVSRGGALYDPAQHANHGGGLFLVGVEQTGDVVAYALDQTAGTYERIGSYPSGFPSVMDLAYDPETTHVWAVCDDSCGGRSTWLDIGADGAFGVTALHARPASAPDLNNEGFTIAPQAECVGGFKPVYYADDSNTAGVALRAGTVSCTALPSQDPGPGPGGAPAGGGAPVVTPGTTTPPPPVKTPADRTAPTVKAKLKASKLRAKGRFSLTVTLGERATVKVGATFKARKGAKARSLLKATRKGLAAGKRTLTFTLSRKARKRLRKGGTLTVTLVARDAAGNARKRTVSAKVG